MNDIINPETIGRAVTYAVWFAMAVCAVLSGISCFSSLDERGGTSSGNEGKRVV